MYEDATAAWDYLVREIGIDPRDIIFHGHSLGGAVAAEPALRRGAACAIVFEGTFTTMAEIGRLAYPIIPVDWLHSERFDTLSKVTRLTLPMLFVHGTADEEVRRAMSERLYRAARGDRQLVIVEGAGHEDARPAGGTCLSEEMARLTGTAAIDPKLGSRSEWPGRGAIRHISAEIPDLHGEILRALSEGAREP